MSTSPLATVGDRDIGLGGLGDLVASAEPAVVFSSLATLSVPDVADECVVTIQEEHGVAYRVCVPSDESSDETARADWGDGTIGSGQLVSAGTLSTPIIATPLDGEPTYSGVVVHRWRDLRRPTRLDRAVTALVVQMAVAVITQERQAARVRAQTRTTETLRVALESNREIGAAIGILMATCNLDQAQAFEMLRSASQAHNRKLRDIAADVVYTGARPEPDRQLSARRRGVDTERGC